MLRHLTTSLFHKINVYSGISPSLLATMSLAVDIKGQTHHQLVQCLQKANLIASKEQLQAWEKVDRKYFTKSADPYQNKPYPISKGESMTDVFTHAVVLNNLTEYWKNNIKVLDIGTGHGFLAFLVQQIIEEKGLKFCKITGIDINEQSIQKCKQIQATQFKSEDNLNFQCTDLNEFLKSTDSTFDVIIGGYYIDQKTNDALIDKMSQNGVGIWPTQSEQGQALYKIKKNKEKAYLMETLFSMPVVRSSVERYFFAKGEKQTEDASTEQEEVEKVEMNVEEKLQMRKKIEEKIRGELKQLLLKNKKTDGKLPNLQQMKEHPQIKSKLDQLQKVSKMSFKDLLKIKTDSIN